jgi:UDP-N-acetyl-D-galactosamine dehydrogenase
VLLAAGSKWNFLPFRPGLVGGHCIGVDPYYITHKAQLVGYQPEIILAGRNLNDSMGEYVVDKLARKMIDQGISLHGSNILILGLTFKENCPDIRNTKVIDIAQELKVKGAAIDVFDPWIEMNSIDENENFDLVTNPAKSFYDAIIVAVSHDEFKKLGSRKILSYAKEDHVFFDLKYLFPLKESNLRF